VLFYAHETGFKQAKELKLFQQDDSEKSCLSDGLPFETDRKGAEER
jgi:hypothetical protein